MPRYTLYFDFQSLSKLILNYALLVLTVSSCEKKELTPKPIADFTFSTEGNGLVVFSNESINATSYVWNFGDSLTSTDVSPTHSFKTNGSYQVTLIATGSGGSSDTTQTVNITNVPNANGCLPTVVPACGSTTDPISDTSVIPNLLVGTWNWQSSYTTWPYTNEYILYPYPDGCNMKLILKADLTYELLVGSTSKSVGTYTLDQEDLYYYDDLLRNYGGPNPTHVFKTHVSFTPDPVITEQKKPSSPIQEIRLSGLLTISENCMDLWHWRRDIHGFEYTDGSKYVK